MQTFKSQAGGYIGLAILCFFGFTWANDKLRPLTALGLLPGWTTGLQDRDLGLYVGVRLASLVVGILCAIGAARELYNGHMQNLAELQRTAAPPQWQQPPAAGTPPPPQYPHGSPPPDQ